MATQTKRLPAERSCCSLFTALMSKNPSVSGSSGVIPIFPDLWKSSQTRFCLFFCSISFSFSSDGSATDTSAIFTVVDARRHRSAVAQRHVNWKIRFNYKNATNKYEFNVENVHLMCKCGKSVVQIAQILFMSVYKSDAQKTSGYYIS